MTNPIEKAKRVALGKITAFLLRKAAAGELGAAAKWAYWNFRGIKTWAAAGFGFAIVAIEGGQQSGLCDLLAAVAAWVDCGRWLDAVQWAFGVVGVGFLYLGQVDGALHDEAPWAPAQPIRPAGRR